MGGVLSAAILYVSSRCLFALSEKGLRQVFGNHGGGAPSTQLVSWKNDRLGDGLKGKYHKMVRQDLGLPMAPREEEQANQQKDAKMTEDAFRGVNGVIRKKDA